MDRTRRRQAARTRRIRLRRLVLACLAAVGFVVGITVNFAFGEEPHERGATTVPRTGPSKPIKPRLTPPSPIPGYLLIADRGNNRLLLVDSAKHILWRYPGPAGAAFPFRFDDDAFFGPNLRTIISNQEDQHTIQVFSFPGGRLLWRYGHLNTRGSGPGYLNTPDDAYLLRNGLVSVADAYNCRVQFISPAGRVVRQIGTTGVCGHNPPRSLGAINGATPLPGGGTLVSEINGSWVDAFSRTGRLMWSFQAPVSYPSDPQWLGGGRILLADYARPGHALIVDTHGRVFWRYGPASGPGELDHPSLALPIGHGLIAINDDYRHRVVLVSIRLRRIVWQYGKTDVPGSRPGLLNTPDGLDLLPFARALRIPVIRTLVTRVHAQSPAVPLAPAASPGIVAATLPYRLPAALERAVAEAWQGRILIAGGLDSASRSAAGVFSLDTASGKLKALGSFPQAFHDAAGAVIGTKLFVFGGGAAQSSSAVQAFDLRTNRATVVARLPRPLSDVSAGSLGGAVYLVGGYDGVRPRAEILRTRDGLHFVTVATLPVGLRYAAAAAAGSRLLIAGGQTAGGLSSQVYLFDPRLGKVESLGQLPEGIAHAAAVPVGGTVYVVGGRNSNGNATNSVSAIDTAKRSVTRVRLPLGAVADSAVAQFGTNTFLIGGWRGTPLTSIVEIRPR